MIMKLKFIGKKSEFPDVYTFEFEPQQPMEWQPGQYMHYLFTHPNSDERGIERWFTISAPPYKKHITITTRLAADHGSSFKAALMALKPGDTVEADGPKGKFVLQDGASKHVLIAGGIGITPYHSMLVQLAHDNKPANADLLYANRDQQFVFDEELGTIAAKDPTLRIIKFVDKKITEPDLTAYLTDPKTVFYLSGPEAMVDSYEDLLGSLGVEPARIMTDYFPGY
jgi:ferredoxin-NADP reductase